LNNTTLTPLEQPEEFVGGRKCGHGKERRRQRDFDDVEMAENEVE